MIGILGKKIITLKLGEAPKIMHYPKSLLDNHFIQEHMKTAYTHLKDPGDSTYQGANEFSSVVRKVTLHDEKNLFFHYHQ